MVNENVPDEEKVTHIEAMKKEIQETWSRRVRKAHKVGDEVNYTIPEIASQGGVRSPKTMTII
jgi:hypothetical protein